MQNSPLGKPTFHYGWVIVFAGMLCIVACLGFGRFALGMLLPSMAATLHLSYSQMGFISTANFLGYLASVLVSAHWAGRIGSRRLIFLALLTVAISMSLVSRATGFLSVLLLYMITGIGSGATNVPVMGLVAAWFSSAKRGRAAGFIVIGSGFAIMIAGRMIPFLNRWIGPEGWRTSWLILAGLVMLIAFVAVALLRDGPEEKGLAPVGADDTAAPVDPGPAVTEVNIYRKGIIYYLGAIYFLFGYTYVIYATFIVTTLVTGEGILGEPGGQFLDVGRVPEPVLGTRLRDAVGPDRPEGRADDRLFPAGGLLPSHRHEACPGCSCTCRSSFSASWRGASPRSWRRRSAITSGRKSPRPPSASSRSSSGLGQISGPAVAGVLAERTGSFSGSFYMAAAFAGVAIVLSGFLRKPQTA